MHLRIKHASEKFIQWKTYLSINADNKTFWHRKRNLLFAFTICIVTNCSDKGENVDTPSSVSQSAADMVTGTYNGSAQRWYTPSTSSSCYTDASTYTKSDAVTISVIKLTDSTVTLNVLSKNNIFQAFPTGSNYILRVRKSGSGVIVDHNYLALGNASSYPYGPVSISFAANTINGRLDLSWGGCQLNPSSWNKLDGVSFSGSK